MNCPTCNVQLLMMERMGIPIDYCPQCRGIWLEKGKLDKMIEKATGEATNRTAPPGYNAQTFRQDYGGHGSHDNKHHDSHHDDHYDGQRKRRSFLHDLFD